MYFGELVVDVVVAAMVRVCWGDWLTSVGASVISEVDVAGEDSISVVCAMCDTMLTAGVSRESASAVNCESPGT